MKRWALRSFTFTTTLIIGLLLGVRFPPSYSSSAIPDVINNETIACDFVVREESYETIPDMEIGHAESTKDLKLVETGNFHGDEIVARNGEMWLGLYVSGQQSRLKPSKVSVRRVHDSIVDETPSAKTGKLVSVDEKHAPLFLLRNHSKMKQGPVKTIFRGLSYEDVVANDPEGDPYELMTSMDKDFEQKFDFDGIDYTLKVIRAANADGNRILALVLETNSKRQVLHTMRTSYEGERGEQDWLGSVGTLFWVGDIDRDGGLDFYLSAFVHENVANHVLFLSSKSKKGQIVGIASQFVTTGC